MNKSYLLFSLICLLSSPVFSVTTSFWKIRNFEKCKLKNVMLDKNGFASLAPETKQVWENPEVYIWSMLEIGNTLYVGTGAEGKIYKIENGKSSLVFDTKEAGVFSLTQHNHKIYAGTSPNGKIFVIDKNGKPELFKDTYEKYVWEIVFDEHDNLYAATGTCGRIIKITKKGKIDTFYKTQRMNVPFLAYFGHYFYAGTGEEGLTFKIDRHGKGFCIWDAPEKEITGIILIDTLLFISATTDTQGSIYMVYPDNRIERIWKAKYPIRGIQKSETHLLATAGNRLYRISKNGDSELLAELETGISCIINNWVGTSEVGKVYNLAKDLAPKGTIESPSYDTKSISKWGKLDFTSTSEIKFRTRTGNIKEPDPTWDEWRVVGEEGEINSPPARFIQWEATIISPTSKLEEVKIPFLPQNEKPVILEIKITEPKKLKKGIPEGAKRISWKAIDPNKDSLIFNLYFKLTDEEIWTLLKESLDDTLYYIDPKSFPDGEYEFKIGVSDSPSNPPEEALKSERISKPYLIDNTPPVVTITELKNKSLSFEVADNLGVKSCQYALDGSKWRVVFPMDKLFDSELEKFKIGIGEAQKVVIRAQDIYGNITLKSKLIK